MKKLISYLIFIILCIAIGGGLGVIISNYKIDYLFTLDIAPIVFLTLLIVAFLFSVALHEFAHALYFVVHKVPLRFMGIFIFSFLKKDNKCFFSICLNKITVLGGIAIPSLPAIESESDFLKLRKIYSRALLFAPIVSLAEAIICFILYVSLSKYNMACSDMIYIFLVLSSFMGLSIFFSSFIKTETIYGDFPAYKAYKNCSALAALQLCQYMSFSEDWKNTLLKSTWLIEHLKTQLKAKQYNEYKLLDLKILDWLIQLDYLNILTLNSDMFKILKDIFNTDYILLLPVGEDRDIFYFHMIYVLNKYRAIEQADLQRNYSQMESILLVKHPSKEYYIKLTKHLLFNQNYSEWLNKNINPNTTYNLLRVFESVELIEKNIIGSRAIS